MWKCSTCRLHPFHVSRSSRPKASSLLAGLFSRHSVSFMTTGSTSVYLLSAPDLRTSRRSVNICLTALASASTQGRGSRFLGGSYARAGFLSDSLGTVSTQRHGSQSTRGCHTRAGVQSNYSASRDVPVLPGSIQMLQKLYRGTTKIPNRNAERMQKI